MLWARLALEPRNSLSRRGGWSYKLLEGEVTSFLHKEESKQVRNPEEAEGLNWGHDYFGNQKERTSEIETQFLQREEENNNQKIKGDQPYMIRPGNFAPQFYGVCSMNLAAADVISSVFTEETWNTQSKAPPWNVASEGLVRSPGLEPNQAQRCRSVCHLSCAGGCGSQVQGPPGLKTVLKASKALFQIKSNKNAWG